MNQRTGISYKNFRRYKEIAEVLVKYGFGFFVQKLAENKIVPSYVLKRKRENLSISTGSRIRLICEELGPTFIKLGQIASTRGDLFPQEIIEELIKLQDKVREVPVDLLKKVFKEEFNTTVEQAFLNFEEKPIASASIGQVHRAKLISGENVIVKIQKPSIKNVVEVDIKILLSMSKLFDDYFGYMIPFSMYEVIEELATSIRRELDYTREAKNTERFREIFCNDKTVYIPKIYWEYTSKKVLTQEWIDGIKVSNVVKLKKKGWDTVKIADIGARAFLKQIFIHGFFHGDLHPGNILVINNNTVSFIDFGQCGYLDKLTVRLITDMFIAGAKRDVEKIVDLLAQIDAITNDTNIRRLKEDLIYFISYYYNTPLRKINMSEVVSEFMEIIYENNIKLPSQYTVLIKAIITVEGTGRILNPEFSISKVMNEFSGEIVNQKLNLLNVINNIGYVSHEILFKLRDFPKQIRTIIKMLEKNQIKLTLEEIKFKSLERELNKISNKLSLSIIISAFIIGSSLILNINKGPTVLNLPLLAFIGYTAASILGIILIISILIDMVKKD